MNYTKNENVPDNCRILKKKNLYRLPWSLNDNPIGWVEITDKCNISCKGCYRNTITGHKPLEEIKKEISFLEEWRNIGNVQLGGGEPLLHPDIVDIVRFIKKRGLTPYIVTNGKRLDKELLLQLKNAGLIELSFHIDSGQRREGWIGKNENELNELRQYYTEMLCEVGGVNCNFNMTVSPKNIEYVPNIIQWALSNGEKVTGFTFVTLRGSTKKGVTYIGNDKVIDLNSKLTGLVTDFEDDMIELKSTDLYNLIKSNFPQYEVSSYLGGTITPSAFKWLIANVICCEDQMLCSLSPHSIELAQILYHLFSGKYYIGSHRKIGVEVLLLSLVDKHVRKALAYFLRCPGQLLKKVHMLTIGVLQPAEMLSDGQYEMCDGCPDATYFNGRLVNCCRLDEYRLYGKPVTPVIEKSGNK